MTSVKEICILGGGFAGVYTARVLEKLLKPGEANVTLVNRENYWVYQPMLPEVISGSIGLLDVVSPIRALCPGTNFLMRDVERIDLDSNTVTVSPGFMPRRKEVRFDYLVIALGNATDFYGMPGMLENAFPFKNLADALALRNHVIRTLEEAESEDDPALQQKLLTFVVGGGGFSGVEVVAELNDFVNTVKANYRRLETIPARCILVQSGNRILPEMAEPLALFAQKILRRRGVRIILQDRLVAATSEKAVLKSGEQIACKTIVSTVPSGPVESLRHLDVAKEKGKLLVNTQLEVVGHEGKVWALGDCAAIKTVSGKPVPPTAQHATREATTAATNIVRALRGGEEAHFAFEGLGTLSSLGHGSAVAQIFGIKLSGLIAFVLWRFIYLMKMPGVNRKVRISLGWLIRLLFPPDFAQARVSSPSGVQHQHFEPGDYVFSQGDVGDKVYIIEKGECEVIREDETGDRVLAELRPGECFGEMGVMGDSLRMASIRARTPLDVVVIEKADFLQLRRSVPEFGSAFEKIALQRKSPPEKQSSLVQD